MKKIPSLLLAGALSLAGVAPAARAAGAASGFAHLSVPGPAAGTCVDAQLTITFDSVPVLGVGGAVQIHRADGGVVDQLDVATAASDSKVIGGAVSDGGEPHRFRYHSVIVNDNAATIYLHRQLEYGETYYLTVDPGAFVGFPGVSDPTAWRFSTRRHHQPRNPRHVVVAANGTGDFCTVQGAIDAVPDGNEQAVTVDVRPGTYSEIDYVRADKPHITVRGAGVGRTVIQYDNNDRLNGDSALKNGGTSDICPRRVLPQPDLHNCWRAMFGVDAADFTLRDITLHNTTPYGGSQAEAFRGNNARIVLDHVALRSFQDTLRLQQSGFVKDSYIEGDVDFIWGTGSVVVEGSEIRSLHPGYVTQIRNADNAGDVFVNDRFTRASGVPDGSVYLSRIETQRFPNSQVVFIDSAMDSHIKPVGWQITPDDCTAAPYLRFWEYRSVDLAGNPVDTSQRLACSRQITEDEARRWSDPATALDGWEPWAPAAAIGGLRRTPSAGRK